MKTKLFFSLALAAALVGCSEDELATADMNKAENQSGMIELDDNFMIGAVGVNDATTRTHWELNNNALTNVFSPIAVATGGNNQISYSGGVQHVDAPSIGLCWVGQSVGDNVYTNYEFFHNGWLGKDETSAIFNPCNDAELTNGWLYSDLQLSAAVTAGQEAVTKSGGSLNATSSATKHVGGDATKAALALNDMNLNSGVYKTENKAIFGGNYIAYYPYNPDFKDAGTIPAKSEVVFTDLKKNNEKDFQLANNTFRYTNVASINGGDQAKGFGFKNLSGVIRLVLKSKSTTALGQKIDKVLLYSASGAFKKQVRLSAAKINAGATGTALYASTDSASKTILATMKSGEELTAVASNANAATLVNGTVYLTALPTTISDLVVLAHDNTADTWAECTVGNVEIPAGGGKQIVASFADGDFEPVYYAVDAATLTAAITACSGASLSANKTASIKVLGDVVIANATIPPFVTVEGDKLIVPEDVTLTVNDNTTIKSVVEIQGQACCSSSTVGGKMAVDAGATIAGNVNVLAGAEGKKAGSLEFANAAGKTSVVAATSTITSDGDIAFKGQTDIRGTLTLNDGAKATVEEKTADVNVKGGTVNNNGTVEVLGKFAMLAADGSTVAAAGGNFKNNGTFIDNVGSTVGGATQYMVFGENGEYICKVDGENRMNEAYENKTAASIIEIVGAQSQTYTFAKVRKHNDKDVDIVVSTNSTKFEPASAITIGNLTVNQGLRIQPTKEVTGANGAHVGWATITVNGDITAKANFFLSVDVRNMEADNLTVVKGGHAKFENRKESQDKTLVVSKTISVEKDGMFEIAAKTAGQNIALVTCTKLVEGGTFVGKPEVVAE